MKILPFENKIKAIDSISFVLCEAFVYICLLSEVLLYLPITNRNDFQK